MVRVINDEFSESIKNPQERYRARRRAQGLCKFDGCKNKAEKMCDKHKALYARYKREWYARQKLKAQGILPGIQNNPEVIN